MFFALIKIANLLNGYLRTPKLNRFNEMIDWLNNDTQSSIIKHSADTSLIFGNAWLAGFIDADGSFDVRIRLKSKGATKNRVEARFRLKQRMIDPKTGYSYFEVLTQIANTLKIKLKNSNHHNTQYYLITLTSQQSRDLLVNYLNRFPLFSSKRLNYEDWLLVHNMIENKEYLTDLGRDKCIQLSNGMNNNRRYYNWDHLESLKSY